MAKPTSITIKEIHAVAGQTTRSAKGKRLRYLREFARISRDEASEITESAYSTYKDWENGKGSLPIDKANWFVEEAQSRGVICTIDWLIDGVGYVPEKGKRVKKAKETKKTNN